jgi:hypothetical protein
MIVQRSLGSIESEKESGLHKKETERTTCVKESRLHKQ